MNINKYNHNMDIFVTCAIMLDWLPSFFFGIDSSFFSGTKTIAMPLIIIDFLRNSNIYLKWNFALYFFVSFIIGVGGGVIIGVVPFSWFWQLLPIIPILYFYQKPRSFERIRTILKTCFYTALFLPLSLLLTHFGLFTASAEIIGKEGEQHRISAGTSWSSLGLIVIAISSTLAGLLVVKKSKKLNLRTFLLRAFILIVSLTSVFLTGLKSSIGAFIITFSIGFLFSSYIDKKNRIRFITSLIFIFFIARSYIIKIFAINLSRYEGLTQETDSIAIRIEQWSFFFGHLISKHSLFPIGMENAMKGRWRYSYSHFIIGEAYFFGGLIFMIPIILLFYKSIRGAILTFKLIDNNIHKQTVLALISYLLGMLIILNFMPGLHTRVTYIILGLGLALDFNINKYKKL